jgi:hypothetical protein
VGVGVVEAGHREGAFEVDDVCPGPFEFENVGVGACGEDFSTGDREGGDFGRGCGGIVLAEVNAGEDVAVKEDGVGRLRLGERCQKEDCAEREGFHGWECSRVTPLLPEIAQSLPMTGVRFGPGLQVLHLPRWGCKVLIPIEKERVWAVG